MKANIKSDIEENKPNLCNFTQSPGVVTGCIKTENTDNDCKCIECLGTFIEGERNKEQNKLPHNQANSSKSAEPGFDSPNSAIQKVFRFKHSTVESQPKS